MSKHAQNIADCELGRLTRNERRKTMERTGRRRRSIFRHTFECTTGMSCVECWEPFSDLKSSVEFDGGIMSKDAGATSHKVRDPGWAYMWKIGR